LQDEFDFISDIGQLPKMRESIGIIADKLRKIRGDDLVQKLHAMKTKTGFEMNEDLMNDISHRPAKTNNLEDIGFATKSMYYSAIKR
jgi:predicted transcriptional regulator